MEFRLKPFFDRYIETAFDGNAQAEHKFVQFERNYRSFFPADKSLPLLDIGIGRGEMLSCMKAWGYAGYKGVDISPSAVNHCAKLDLNCELVPDTVAWLHSVPNQWHLITLLDVLEHFRKEDLLDFLAAVRLALAPGGKLTIHVPNLQSPNGYLHRYNDLTHEVGFTEHSLIQLLAVAGFGPAEIHSFEESISSEWKEYCRLSLRYFYRAGVRLARKVHGNLNPTIISPIMFVVVAKE